MATTQEQCDAHFATAIDEVHIKYHCPKCNGIHMHGSNGDLSSREEMRSSHCGLSHHDDTVRLIVTAATKRPSLKRKAPKKAHTEQKGKGAKRVRISGCM